VDGMRVVGVGECADFEAFAIAEDRGYFEGRLDVFKDGLESVMVFFSEGASGQEAVVENRGSSW
jgi:hypothetical protein